MAPKEVKQDIALEEVSTTVEILEEVDISLEVCKRFGINKLEVLPSMKDNHHHGTINLYDFEDPFLRKESARDEGFNFFNYL